MPRCSMKYCIDYSSGNRLGSCDADVPDVHMEGHGILSRPPNKIMRVHDSCTGKSSEGCSGTVQGHLMDALPGPGLPTVCNHGSTHSLTVPMSHPKLSARDCTNSPVTQIDFPERTNTINPAPFLGQADGHIDSSAGEGPNMGHAALSNDSARFFTAAPTGTAAQRYNKCSEKITMTTGPDGHKTDLLGRSDAISPVSEPHKWLWGSSNRNNISHDPEYRRFPSGVSMNEEHALHDWPAPEHCSRDEGRCPQGAGQPSTKAMGITDLRMTQHASCNQSVQPQMRKASFACSIGPVPGGGQSSALRLQELSDLPAACPTHECEGHRDLSAPVSVSDMIDQVAAWKERMMSRSPEVAPSKPGKHVVDSERTSNCRMATDTTTVENLARPSLDRSCDGSWAAVNQPSCKVSFPKRQQDAPVGDNIDNSVEIPLQSSNDLFPHSGNQSCNLAGNDVLDPCGHAKTAAHLTDEDDTLLAAVIQDILQDDPLDTPHKDSPSERHFASGGDTNTDCEAGGDQHMPGLAMEGPWPHSCENLSPKDDVRESQCKCDLVQPGADGTT